MTLTIHPSARQTLIDWLEEAAADACDAVLYPNPHLAGALRALADEVRRAGPACAVITTSPEGSQ